MQYKIWRDDNIRGRHCDIGGRRAAVPCPGPPLVPAPHTVLCSSSLSTSALYPTDVHHQRCNQSTRHTCEQQSCPPTVRTSPGNKTGRCGVGCLVRREGGGCQMFCFMLSDACCLLSACALTSQRGTSGKDDRKILLTTAGEDKSRNRDLDNIW